MPDIMPAEKRSSLGRIRGRDTTPERYLHALLEAAGLSFSSHDPDLPGRPDFVFRTARVAVFVDADFWHVGASPYGRPSCRKGGVPRSQ
jgi:DNA mismatch endonuclease (patch repair protein)